MNSKPLRKCIGCGLKKYKEEFLMVSRPPKSDTSSPLTISNGKNKKGGRSAYICKSVDCIRKAKKARRLERTFPRKVNFEIYDNLEKMIKNNEGSWIF